MPHLYCLFGCVMRWRIETEKSVHFVSTAPSPFFRYYARQVEFGPFSEPIEPSANSAERTTSSDALDAQAGDFRFTSDNS